VTIRRLRGPYTLRDKRYVAEWVIANYPHAQVIYNLRLGPPPTEIAAKYPGLDLDRFARVWKKTCDAVVITGDEVILIEGELRRPLLALGELLIYRSLLHLTPELMPYRNMPVRTILLCPLEDPTLTVALREHKIEQIAYRPPWVAEYHKEVMR
jgi:hypothetical protein